MLADTFSHKQEFALIASKPSAHRFALCASAAAIVALAGCAQPAKEPAPAAAPAPASAAAATPATASASSAQATNSEVERRGQFLQYVNESSNVVTVQMTLPDASSCEALVSPLRQNWIVEKRPSMPPSSDEASVNAAASKAIRCSSNDLSRQLPAQGAFITKVNGMRISLSAITLELCKRALGENSPSVEIIAECK